MHEQIELEKQFRFANRLDQTPHSIMGSLQHESFCAPPEKITTRALLFDFDGEYQTFGDRKSLALYSHLRLGTIIDSTEAIVKHWHK